MNCLTFHNSFQVPPGCSRWIRVLDRGECLAAQILLQNSKKVSAVRSSTLTDTGKSVKLCSTETTVNSRNYLTLTQTREQLNYLSSTLNPSSHSLVFTYWRKRTNSPKLISDSFILIFVFYSCTCSWGSITWYLKDQNKAYKTGHVTLSLVTPCKTEKEWKKNPLKLSQNSYLRS